MLANIVPSVTPFTEPLQLYNSVLADGLDQLPLREILFTVILTLVIRVEVCKIA
jgi:hypothetical protein